MKAYEIIKKLRTEANLTQEQFGRMIFPDGGTLTGAAISQYENNKGQIPIELFEKMVEVFGYSLDLKLIDKVKNEHTINFYKPKSGDCVVSMPIDKQLEYIFIVLDAEKWSRILKMTVEQINLLPLVVLRDLLKISIEKINPLALAYIIDAENSPHLK